jgi:hypothetical protein
MRSASQPKVKDKDLTPSHCPIALPHRIVHCSNEEGQVLQYNITGTII